MSGGACENNFPIREDFFRDAALAELRNVLTNPKLWMKLQAKIEDRIRNYRVETNTEEIRLRKDLVKIESEIARLERRSGYRERHPRGRGGSTRPGGP